LRQDDNPAGTVSKTFEHCVYLLSLTIGTSSLSAQGPTSRTCLPL
jgi:hypothetical protein